MTLSNNFEDQLVSTTDILDGSSANWEALYCTHLWSNSNLRKAFISGLNTDNMVTNYCYTCKGKIRKYELKSPREQFIPNNHSTPNGKLATVNNKLPTNELQGNSLDGINSPIVNTNSVNFTKDTSTNVNINQCIPSISRHIDSSFRQKYTSYEMRASEVNERRLRKSLKGIGCIVNLALTDSTVKKRTQIQACSISVMIVAIIVISFILVNFTTPSYKHDHNATSTILVPTVDYNITSSAITVTETASPVTTDVTEYTTTEEFLTLDAENKTLLSNIILNIRKNIRTYPKKKKQNSQKPKEIINRDLSPRFCECQTDEICMLDETSGTAMCKKAVDVEDPTGCGGLCALETEACQLVDRSRGVRVCRLLTLVTCSPHEWRCRNGLCVPAETRCDGTIQCYDRSDEMHCDCDLTKQFRCGHSISCFSNTKLCNGIIDCWDGYDEVNCTAECAEHQFTCTDGQCILPSRFCDGLADCEDGSDEPQGCGACAAHEMRCMNQRCVPRNARCDGLDNCGDASDEIHCS